MKPDLQTVLSAAYSLKHASDMEKSFPTQEEAFDRAKPHGLNPRAGSKTDHKYSHRSSLLFYDEKKGEIVKSDRWRPPDFRSLIKIAQTEQGRSEVSCMFEDRNSMLMAKTHDLLGRDRAYPFHLSLIRLVCKPTKTHQTGRYPMS